MMKEKYDVVVANLKSESTPTIHDVMRSVVSGMYAAGACNKGFSHGCVTIRDGVLRSPVAGTPDAEFRYTCLHHYTKREDFWVVMYEGMWVFLRTTNIPVNFERMYLATVARQCIENDLASGILVFENI